MHKLYEYACDELKELEKKAGDKGLSASELEFADKLTELKKNILKIEMLEDEGYSAEYRDDMMPRYRGGSYARGRGRNARRDTMGRYSRGYSYEFKKDLEELIEDAPNEHIKQKMRDLMHEM